MKTTRHEPLMKKKIKELGGSAYCNMLRGRQGRRMNREDEEEDQEIKKQVS